MKIPYIDTNIIIRYVDSTNLDMQEASARLFNKVQSGEVTIQTSSIVIAETVWVLSSKNLYALSRDQIRDTIAGIIRYPNFKLENKNIILDALDIYASSGVKFVDALLISAMRQGNVKAIYSHDHHFDNLSDIKRIEP